MDDKILADLRDYLWHAFFYGESEYLLDVNKERVDVLSVQLIKPFLFNGASFVVTSFRVSLDTNEISGTIARVS